jgi:DNA polymerase-2
MSEAEGFIVAAWDELSGRVRPSSRERKPDEPLERVFLTGRLADGRSFAAILPGPGPAVYVPAAFADRAREVLASFLGGESPPGRGGRDVEPGPCAEWQPWTSLEGESLARFELPFGALAKAERALAKAEVPVRAAERRRSAELLASLGIHGRVRLRGESVPGRRVDAVFLEPEFVPPPTVGLEPIPLRWLALDIETDREGRVLALSMAEAGQPGEVLFLRPVAGVGAEDPVGTPTSSIACFDDEGALLAAFARRLVRRDPDVITGWNVLDFDLRVLARRFAAFGLPFDIGRTAESASFVDRPGRRAVFDLPGRCALDAMRLVRAGGGGSGERFEEQSLEAVAQAVLGEGKAVAAKGEAKLIELERLRREEPTAFCAYCLGDSELVLRILAKTGLDRLTAERAALTGVGLDLAWTSIPSFERVYGAELRARRVLPPAREERRVSGAAGGTVLDPQAGIFPNVLVLDFRSLYPSIMRTFNVDPLAHARAEARPPEPGDIVAPNGARFEREPGIMPELIARYSAEREAAIASGDEYAAFVLKILQNSFYGVLGAEGCRYARTELAGAITSFGKKYLVAARDFFESRGMRVLYGDTDSVFVLSGSGDGAERGELMEFGSELASRLNAELAKAVEAEYRLDSVLKIRCEKIYRRFLIPRLKAFPTRGHAASEDAGRGRAKGYAGLLLLEGGGAEVEVKGMEAARSDFTPLARGFQVELLGLVFAGAGEAELAAFCASRAASLRRGELDDSLVYRKALRRPAMEYATQTPPVRAARLLGWTNRRGRVSYYMTRAGAEPEERRSGSPLDYGHYVERQLLPIALSIADAIGFDARPWFVDMPQLELDFGTR